MEQNLNEKSLLKFISGANLKNQNQVDIIDAICQLGIKLEFKNENPVYQIIDELIFADLIRK